MIAATGQARIRPEESTNLQLVTGEIEVEAVCETFKMHVLQSQLYFLEKMLNRYSSLPNYYRSAHTI